MKEFIPGQRLTNIDAQAMFKRMMELNRSLEDMVDFAMQGWSFQLQADKDKLNKALTLLGRDTVK